MNFTRTIVILHIALRTLHPVFWVWDFQIFINFAYEHNTQLPRKMVYNTHYIYTLIYT